MKSFMQVGVPVIVLMGVVAVVAFMTQHTAHQPLPTIGDDTPAPLEGEPITFAEGEINIDNKPVEVEYHSHPHRDYWFYTTQERDAMVALWYKSCGCADVDIGTFDLGQTEYEAIASNPTPAALCRLLDAVSFKKMKEVKHNESDTILATKPGRKPWPYILRINWEVKKSPAEAKDKQLIHVELNATLRDSLAPVKYSRDIEYVIVPATGFWPGNVDLGDIGPGGLGARDCIIWSPTRDRLSFTARVTAAHDGKESEPCAEISDPVKLTPEEMAALPRTMGHEMLKIQPKSAYKFRVTLHERRGDTQLEMGPLTRRLVVKFITPAGEENLNSVSPSVSALVRGEVSVLNGDDVGRVNLGTFKFDRARTVDVKLGSPDPKLELEIENISNDKLHVSFVGAPTNIDGRREWTMRVELEANAGIGPFGANVMLRVKNNPGRRLRIPVSGSAER